MLHIQQCYLPQGIVSHEKQVFYEKSERFYSIYVNYKRKLRKKRAQCNENERNVYKINKDGRNLGGCKLGLEFEEEVLDVFVEEGAIAVEEGDLNGKDEDGDLFFVEELAVLLEADGVFFGGEDEFVAVFQLLEHLGHLRHFIDGEIVVVGKREVVVGVVEALEVLGHVVGAGDGGQDDDVGFVADADLVVAAVEGIGRFVAKIGEEDALMGVGFDFIEA